MGRLKWCSALSVVMFLFLAGCAAGKIEAKREQQQALVRELTAMCGKGQPQACARVEGEQRVLFEVYGCHCKDSLPPDHKPVWAAEKSVGG